MQKADVLPRPNKLHQFSIRNLFYSTTAFALVLSLANWLGNPFGYIAFCPFLILVVQVSLTGRRSLLIAAIGFTFGSVGGGMLTEWPFTDVNLYRCAFTLGMFGAAIASGAQLLWMKRLLIGLLTTALTVMLLLYLLLADITVT